MTCPTQRMFLKVEKYEPGLSPASGTQFLTGNWMPCTTDTNSLIQDDNSPCRVGSLKLHIGDSEEGCFRSGTPRTPLGSSLGEDGSFLSVSACSREFNFDDSRAAGFFATCDPLQQPDNFLDDCYQQGGPALVPLPIFMDQKFTPPDQRQSQLHHPNESLTSHSSDSPPHTLVSSSCSGGDSSTSPSLKGDDDSTLWVQSMVGGGQSDEGAISPMCSATTGAASNLDPSCSGGIGAGRRTRQKIEKVCGVCGDRALSFNFDAVSCESCKAFFRRNAAKGMNSFKCAYRDKCRITVANRRFCKRCRLRRCFEIGMKKEYILSEEERQSKKLKIDQNKMVRKLEERGWLSTGLLPGEIDQRDLLSEQEISVIDAVEKAYKSSLQIRLEERVGRRSTPSLMDLINFAEVSVRRMIEMVKKVPEFRSLPQSDQVVLLKGGAIELLILRGVLTYNPEKQHFLDQEDVESTDSLSVQDLVTGAGSDAGITFIRFAQSLITELKCDRISLMLLLAICLFSDRGGLGEVPSPGSRESSQHRVECAQIQFSDLLRKYLTTIHTRREGRRLFPHLLFKLTELRQLNEMFSRQIIQVSPTGIQPLMSEILQVSAPLDDLPPADSPDACTPVEMAQLHPAPTASGVV